MVVRGVVLEGLRDWRHLAANGNVQQLLPMWGF